MTTPKLHPAQLRTLRSRLRLSINDASLTDLSPAARDIGADRAFWELEPQPLIIESDEWSLLVDALRQRARLVNALLSDLYSAQVALHRKLLPPELVLADPYYRRPCLGLEPGRPSPATLLRFDLVKTLSGWVFTQTRANTPVGISYAVQNRRFMTQEAGMLYRSLPDYHSVINFPLQLLDALRALAPRPGRAPSIVVLTAGPQDPFYSEHSFLARKMGLPLARGDDLLVLDNRVYFKTIAGLEQVDVIYRRLNDAHIDPVVFPTHRETAGIPGLLQSIRTGNVAVANSIGAGLAESRALEAYLPVLMRFYLGEKPLLPSIPTYTCGDNDHLDHILDHRDSLRVLPAHDPRPGQAQPRRRLLGRSGLAHEVRENPFAYVAQPSMDSLAGRPGGRRGAPALTLSAFVLCQGDRLDVFPGGLVQVGRDAPAADRLGKTADALVLLGSTSTGAIPDLEADSPERPARVHALGSRAAEGLFWLGRYLERAESTGRMLSIFDDVTLEEIPARERRRWLPIWRGLLDATGHGDHKLPSRGSLHAVLGADLAWRMTLDAANPSSIRSSITWASDNARQLRDHISPESWSILSRLRMRLDSLDHHREGPREHALSAVGGIASVLTDINAFLSTAERTMLHDACWHFLRMGLHLERAIMTCSVLRHVLGSHDEKASGAQAKPEDLLLFRDNPELSALLRMLGSQDVYRRLYQTRSRRRFVAELLLQQAEAPRSILHLLRQIRASLQAIQLDVGEAPESQLTMQMVESHLQFVAGINLALHFTAEPSAPSIGEHLSDLLDRLYGLHPLLSDHYFSHQARLSPPQDQAELPL